MPGRPNNAVVVDACTRRLNALESYVDGKVVIGINGKHLTLSDVIAIYQGSLDSRAALATQRAITKAAMAVRADAEVARREADRALRAWVENHFGIGSTEAIDFGFPPARKPARTVENKANAVALAKATREARHTMGLTEKRLIKGTLASSTQTVREARGFSAAVASPGALLGAGGLRAGEGGLEQNGEKTEEQCGSAATNECGVHFGRAP